MKKEIPIVFGQNLVQVRASYNKKSGFIKILLVDEDINDFFTKTVREGLGKEPTKRIFLAIQ
jgi:hypothetical protein